MRTWLALLIAPSLALACQTLMYSLVTPACSVQTRVLIHAAAAACLVLAALFTLMARGHWRQIAVAAPPGVDHDGADPASTRRFLAAVATAVGGLSVLVILMMWIAAWVLSPCF